jgi:hypothetical protein
MSQLRAQNRVLASSSLDDVVTIKGLPFEAMLIELRGMGISGSSLNLTLDFRSCLRQGLAIDRIGDFDGVLAGFARESLA